MGVAGLHTLLMLNLHFIFDMSCTLFVVISKRPRRTSMIKLCSDWLSQMN